MSRRLRGGGGGARRGGRGGGGGGGRGGVSGTEVRDTHRAPLACLRQELMRTVSEGNVLVRPVAARRLC
jgi:hypothetical protein